jgi:hypothetical protein
MFESPFRHKVLSRRRCAARREPASSVAPVFAINTGAPCVLASHPRIASRRRNRVPK